MNAILRRVGRRLKQDGLRGVVRLGLQIVSTKYNEWRLGIDTRHFIHPKTLGFTDPEVRAYSASDYWGLKKAFRAIKRDMPGAGFLDLGAGMGRVLVMAVDAGVDLPWYAYRDLALGEVPREPVRQTKPVRWLSLYTYMGIPLSGARLAPYVPEIVRLMLSARTKFAIWRWDDLWPGVVSTVDTLKAVCRKLVRWLFCRKGR